MKKCWHSDPNKRPTASSILKELDYIKLSELEKPTKIKLSPEIGPIPTNNPGAIYTSRTLSNMIKPAIYTSMSQEAQSLELDPFNYYYQNNNYTSFNELELDINNKRSDKYDNYIIHETKEWELDINNIKSDEYHNYSNYLQQISRQFSKIKSIGTCYINTTFIYLLVNFNCLQQVPGQFDKRMEILY
ncbi:unnamed protein product [Rhizophagus irregularis]|nr:unnamed protein product [Rhizophagus irregularis]